MGRFSVFILAALSCVWLWTASCTKEPEPDEGRASDTPTGAQAGESAAEEGGHIIVKPAGVSEIRAAIAQHKGEVVLLDFWATWCRPCVENFPQLMDWQQKHGSRGLTVLSVSVDFGEDREEKVKAFLERHKPGFETYVLDVPNYDDFVRAIGPQWSGAVPALFIFDRTGQLRHQILGEQPAEAIQSRFLPLLEMTASPAQGP